MLPLLISAPHGGTETPAEIAAKVIASHRDVFDDSDASTSDIYNFEGKVARSERARIARAFIDLNRAPDDRPPANPDGVVKSETCYGKPIYDPANPLTDEDIASIIDRYYHPYHQALTDAAADPGVRLGIDCHSMASTPPPTSPDPGQQRPLFCLSNGDGTTSPADTLERLADGLAAAFEIDRSNIWLNAPFKGGYITRSQPGGIPWVQLEMNRSLYLADPWFDHDGLRVDADRLQDLNDKVYRAFASMNV